MTDPLAPFDDDILANTASEYDLSESRLRSTLRSLHDHVESLSGVEELVYDWRKGLPYDPLVTQTDDTYYLVFFPSVWEEFADQLNWKAVTLEAARAVHDKQARRAAERLGQPVEPYEGAAPFVIAR